MDQAMIGLNEPAIVLDDDPIFVPHYEKVNYIIYPKNRYFFKNRRILNFVLYVNNYILLS